MKNTMSSTPRRSPRALLHRRLPRLLVGAGAIALLSLGVPAATATSSVAGAASAAPAATFHLTPSGASVTMVGTSKWTPTQVAGPSGATASAPSAALPATRAAVLAASPRVPDVATVTARSSTLASAIGSPGRGTHGRGHVGTGPSAGPPGSVSGATAGLADVAGINAYDQGLLHPIYKTGVPQPLPGVDIEPPDQGLCAGNGVVMEVNNMVMQLFTASTMQPLSSNGMALENLFDAPEVFGSGKTGTLSVQGDPRCYYDPQSNRWFASQIWLTEVDGSSTFGWAGEFVAVSETTAPSGAWHVYFIPDQYNANGIDGCNNLGATTLPNATHPTGPANPCYGDQPLLGVDANAVFIETNEYTFAGKKPLGGVATEYALSKQDLVNGTASPIYWGHLGDTITRPGAGTCPFNTPAYGQATSVICPWYSIVPAVSDGAYVTATTGTFYAMSGVTFSTSGGHQVALWTFTNTDAVTTGGPQVTGSVTVTTTVAYAEPPTSAVKGTVTSTEELVPQAQGPHPLGSLWKTLTGATPIKWPSGEGMVASNTDRVTTAAYDPANGSVWAALNTATTAAGSQQAGIAWFRVTPSGAGASLAATDVASGYLSAPAVNDFFPSLAFTGTGQGVLDYALMGRGYFPSTGYSLVGPNGPTATLHIARTGAGPEDGFAEYTATYGRPRWGDYSTALATGSTFYFAAEMVNQSCTVKQFKATFTCGGTRDIEANWGTSVNKLPG